MYKSQNSLGDYKLCIRTFENYSIIKSISSKRIDIDSRFRLYWWSNVCDECICFVRTNYNKIICHIESWLIFFTLFGKCKKFALISFLYWPIKKSKLLIICYYKWCKLSFGIQWWWWVDFSGKLTFWAKIA